MQRVSSILIFAIARIIQTDSFPLIPTFFSIMYSIIKGQTNNVNYIQLWVADSVLTKAKVINCRAAYKLINGMVMLPAAVNSLRLAN